MENINGFEIKEHEKTNRILDIKLNDEIIEKLIYPFNKFCMIRPHNFFFCT